jgi:hypothetical protein
MNGKYINLLWFIDASKNMCGDFQAEICMEEQQEYMGK